MLVIEHNLDVVKTADWVIDLGTRGRAARRTGGRRGHARGDRQARHRDGHGPERGVGRATDGLDAGQALGHPASERLLPLSQRAAARSSTWARPASLAQRLSSYFQRSEGLSEKTQAADGRGDVGRVDRDAHRGRRADPRERADQGEPAALQHAPEGRQELPLRGARHRARPSPRPTSTRVQARQRACATSAPSSTCGRCARRWTNSSRPSRCARARGTSSTTSSASAGPACSTTSASARVRAWAPSTPRATSELVQSWARFFEGDVRQLRNLLRRQMDEASASTSTTRRRRRPATAWRPSSARRAPRTWCWTITRTSTCIAVATEGSRAAVVRFRVRFGRIIGRTRAPGRPLHGRGRRRDPRERADRPLPRRRVRAARRGARERATSRPRSSPQYLSEVRRSARRGRGRPTRQAPPRPSSWPQSDAHAVIDRDSLRRQGDHNVRSRALQELGAALRARAAALSHRVLRHEPPPGDELRRLHGRLRGRAALEERLSPLQRERGPRQRRRRRDGRGGAPPARALGRPAGLAPSSAAPT